MMNILIIFGVALGIINFVILVVYIDKVRKYQKMYETSLAKFNNTANVKDKFVELFERLDEVEQKSIETKKYCEQIKELTSKSIKKVGLVKYNAYDGTENKLSFALALLDGQNDGFLLNHIYSLHGSNIYIKNVVNGKVQERISEEESYALKIAIEETQVQNEEEVVPIVKKVNTKNLAKVKNR